MPQMRDSAKNWDYPEHWDNPAIKSVLERRGFTLTSLARKYGLYESACRLALSGQSRRGAQAISDELGVPIQKLFPGRYLRHRRQPATAEPIAASPKCEPVADSAAAA